MKFAIIKEFNLPLVFGTQLRFSNLCQGCTEKFCNRKKYDIFALALIKTIEYRLFGYQLTIKLLKKKQLYFEKT